MRYEQYTDLIAALLLENKTTGTNHAESMLSYTRMNVQRMKRVEKTLTLTPELLDRLSHISQPCTWLVITEAWCGDAAYALPTLKKITDATDQIELRVILRDEHPELIDAYLTHGGRAIPKLICIDNETGAELATWGPRPQPLQQMFLDYQTLPTPPPHSEIVKDLQLWYARDKGKTMQTEIAALIEQCCLVSA